MIYTLVHIAIMVALAPLFLGLIKTIKMWLLFKKPLSPLQGYNNLAKLVRKEVVISQEASQITHIAPYLVLAPLLIVLLFLPPIGTKEWYIGFVDAFTLTGALALSTFFLMLIGLDSASAFGGIGSSREAFISALVEPGMILVIFALSLIAQNLGIAEAAIHLNAHFPTRHLASYTFAAIAFFLSCFWPKTALFL